MKTFHKDAIKVPFKAIGSSHNEQPSDNTSLMSLLCLLALTVSFSMSLNNILSMLCCQKRRRRGQFLDFSLGLFRFSIRLPLGKIFSFLAQAAMLCFRATKANFLSQHFSGLSFRRPRMFGFFMLFLTIICANVDTVHGYHNYKGCSPLNHDQYCGAIIGIFSHLPKTFMDNSLRLKAAQRYFEKNKTKMSKWDQNDKTYVCVC